MHTSHVKARKEKKTLKRHIVKAQHSVDYFVVNQMAKHSGFFFGNNFIAVPKDYNIH